jgi:hypothetical protein
LYFRGNMMKYPYCLIVCPNSGRPSDDTSRRSASFQRLLQPLRILRSVAFPFPRVPS